MKRVRYVGVPDPMRANRAEMRAFLAAGTINETDVREYNLKRFGAPRPGGGHGPVLAAIPGLTVRVLGPRQGLSRRVAWGPTPDSFVQEISNADWEAIQRLPEASHWELVDGPAAEPETVEQPDTPAEGE